MKLFMSIVTILSVNVVILDINPNYVYKRYARILFLIYVKRNYR